MKNGSFKFKNLSKKQLPNFDKQLSTNELVLFQKKRKLIWNDHQFQGQFKQNIQLSNFDKT